jgi:hypothetical protein
MGSLSMDTKYRSTSLESMTLKSYTFDSYFLSHNNHEINSENSYNRNLKYDIFRVYWYCSEN